MSYHDHNETERAAELLERLVAGERIAVISDAGTPLICDPGYRIVNAAIDAGVEVVVVPGPCALIGALSGSGLPTLQFVFLGFLPRDHGPRAELLARRRFDPATLVMYEAPHRAAAAIDALLAAWGDRPAVIVANLTKPSERWLRGPLSALSAALGAPSAGGPEEPGEDPLRGELTFVVGGFAGRAEAEGEERLNRLIAELVGAGVSVGTVRDVVARVYDLPRRHVYQRALAARERR